MWPRPWITFAANYDSDERLRDFFDNMVKAGLVKAGTDYKKAYMVKLVNGVGLNLRPR